MSDEGPTIVEMAESDWVSPEDRRRMEQEARQREAERLEALRATHAAARPAQAGDTAAAQWSTVASDAFLAACTYLAIGVSNHSAGIAGWAIIGAAACLGVSRFARALPAVTRPLHDWLTDTATLAGMPLVAVWAAALRGTVTPPAWLVPGWLLVSLVFAGAMPRVAKRVGTPLSFAAAPVVVLKPLYLAVTAGAAWLPVVFATLGIALAAASGEFVTPARKDAVLVGGVWRGIDVFHFLLGLGVVCIAHGLSAL